MKYLKKGIKYIGLLFIGVLLAALLLPFVFKGKLITFLKEDINKNFTAIIDFHDADISFLKSFPDVRISIDSLSVTGKDEFEGIVLYKADKTSIDLNLTSLIGDKIPTINSIDLQRPAINVLVLDTLNANYLISKDTTTNTSPTAYKLQLNKYSITDGKLTYQDNTMALYTSLEGIDHEGKGDFTQDIFDLDTKTIIKNMSVVYEGTKYFNQVNTAVDAKINLNFPEEKYTLKDNVIRLNELDLTGDGYVQFIEDDIKTEVTFKTASESFKSLLSMIPNAYTKDFKDVQTKGTASAQGSIKGIYNGAKNMMPGFDISIKIGNAYVKYPSMPQDIKDINADIRLKAERPDYKDMTVNIPDFSMKIGNDPVSGQLMASNLTGDQKVEGHLKGNVNLKNVQSSIPLEGVEDLSGNIVCDLTFKAKMSDVNNENYDAILFSGNATAKKLVYKSAGMPIINIEDATANASPKQINFQGLGMQLGKSDLSLTANIENPLAIFSTGKSINVDMTGNSRFFDLNEWKTEDSGAAAQSQNPEMPIDENLLKNSSLNLKLKADKVVLNEYTLDNFALEGKMAANAIKIDQFTTTIDGNDMQMSGQVANAYDYFFNNGVLDGDIAFSSRKFDTNHFMTTASTASESEKVSVIPVPENVRIKINAHIDDLIYTNMSLKDFAGQLEVRDQEVSITNLTTKTLGGTIAMEGLYNTVDINKPDFAVKMDLSKIKFAEAFSKMDMLKKVAPLFSYLDGIFNTTLVMSGKLGEEMTPDLSTLDASGFIETLSGSLKGLNPISELSQKLGVSELKEINLANTKNWFEIVQGFMELKEFNKNIKGIDLTIAGKHGFGKDMDYNIDLVIPREMLKSNVYTATAESGLSILEKEASKLGINIDQGPNLFVNVKMTGNFKKPSFKITPKTSKGSTVGNAVESKVNEAVATAKDSINKVIKQKQEELKDTINKRANEEIEKLKTKGKAEADKAIDSIKSKAKTEVINKIDSLTKGVVSDSMKQKAKDVLNDKGKEEVEKIKDKLKDFNPFKKKDKG